MRVEPTLRPRRRFRQHLSPPPGVPTRTLPTSRRSHAAGFRRGQSPPATQDFGVIGSGGSCGTANYMIIAIRVTAPAGTVRHSIGVLKARYR
jgi:hypothetical protein